jgi:PAS domain-containing protein
MTKKETPSGAADHLRRRAEKIARAKAARMQENLDGLSPEATRRLLHELRVHQVELEIQNEELRRAQEELEASRSRYFDLYDLAPVGYLTLSEQGLILEANLTLVTLLGVTRGALAKQPLARFIVHQIEMLDSYLRYLLQTPAEVEALFRDLLIGVTNFFRDREAFAALEKQIIPQLFAGKPAGAMVRVWVPGCSTGEEAYSLGILLQEHLEALKQRFKLQVFATDGTASPVFHPGARRQRLPRPQRHSRPAGLFRARRD